MLALRQDQAANCLMLLAAAQQRLHAVLRRFQLDKVATQENRNILCTIHAQAIRFYIGVWVCKFTFINYY